MTELPTVPKKPLKEASDYDKWLFILYCLVGGLSYEGLLKWLSRYETIDEAVDSAATYLDSPFT